MTSHSLRPLPPSDQRTWQRAPDALLYNQPVLQRFGAHARRHYRTPCSADGYPNRGVSALCPPVKTRQTRWAICDSNQPLIPFESSLALCCRMLTPPPPRLGSRPSLPCSVSWCLNQRTTLADRSSPCIGTYQSWYLPLSPCLHGRNHGPPNQFSPVFLFARETDRSKGKTDISPCPHMQEGRRQERH